MAKGFDYQVDHYDKTGRVTHSTPYRMVVDQQEGQRMERPPGSGIWYKPDGSILKDESAAVRAQEAQAQAEQKRLSDEQAIAAREKLKAELRAEIAAEQKEQQKVAQNGSSNKK